MKPLAILLFILFSSFGFSQSNKKTCPELDSLLKQVVFQWKSGNLAKRDSCIKEATKYKSTCRDTTKTNTLVKYQVLSSADKGAFDLCFSLLKEYIYADSCHSYKDSLNTASYYSLKSALYINTEDNKEAMKNIELAIQYLDKSKQPEKYASNNYKRANILRTYNKQEDAIEIYRENLSILDNKYLEVVNYQAMCATFKELKNYDSSNYYAQKALSFYKKTDNEYASYYVRILLFEFKLDLFNETGQNKFVLDEVAVMENAAKKYTELGEMQLSINAKSLLAHYYLKVATNKTKGLAYAKEAFMLAKQNDYQTELLATSKMILEEQIAQNDDSNNYVEAFLNSVKHKYNEENTKAIIGIQEKLNVKEKDEQILKSEKEAAENALIASRNLSYLIYALLGFLLILLIGSFFYVRKQQKTAKKIDELNKKALQLQMNPHFFFNVLNSINSFIVKNDKKEAQLYLSKFSRLMRLTLENSQSNLIPIKKEIELVENYLALEQVRTKNFTYSIEVDEEIKDKNIPPLMIQPFVENSIVHAFRSINHEGKIHVSLKQENQNISISISDNGKGIAHSNTKINPEKSSLALKITRERLNTMFKHKEAIIFDALSSDNIEFPGTLVKFRIPIIG